MLVADLHGGVVGRKRWPGVVGTSLLAVAGHAATFVIAARAAGSTASFAELLPLTLLVLLAAAVPVNVGGWGPREAVTAWAFGAAGLSATQGLTIAVVYGVFAFVAALPGAVVVVARAVARLRAAALGRALETVRTVAPVSPAPVVHASAAADLPAGRELARTAA